MPGGVIVAGVNVRASFTAWPLLTSTLGPTDRAFVAHPGQKAPRLRDAAVGHAVALAAGLGALFACGLWSAPVAAGQGRLPLAQAGDAAAAVAATLMALELLRSHHAPAAATAATALLVATGLARPGRSLLGLVGGLILVLLAARLPLARSAARGDQEFGVPRSGRAGSVQPPAD